MPVRIGAVVGHHALRPDEGTWWWSDGMRALYARDAPGEPAVDLLVEHVHGEDRGPVREAIARCADEGTPFAVRHRVLDRDGGTVEVTLTGARGHDGPAAREVRGMVLDLGAAVTGAARGRASLELGTALASHAVVDQAKGVLALAYGLDEAAAFELLRWCSMRSNVRLTTVAHRLLLSVRDLPPTATATRDLVEARLASASGRTPATGTRPPRVTTGVIGGRVPTVGVRGRADLRAAKELSDALQHLWPVAQVVGRLLVDLEDATRPDPVVRQLFPPLLRRARRDDVILRVALPPDAPADLVGSLAEAASVGRPPVSEPPVAARREG